MKRTLIFLLIFNLFYSIWLYFLPEHNTVFNYLYNIAYSLNYFLGIIVGLSLCRKCHSHCPIHMSFALGSLSYFIAQIIWFYYNYLLQTDIPYPGIADIFFLSFYLFVAIGGIMTMKKIEIKFTLGKIVEICMLQGILFAIIYSFISSTGSDESIPLLTQIINLAYPALDALLITLTLIAIRSQLGRLQPLLLYFFASFIVLAFADTLFAYESSLLTYWNGNIVDGLYMLSSFFFVFGLIELPNLIDASREISTQN